MSYQQLIEPNLSIAGRLGYCLEYARKCFGADVVEPNAWVGWQAAQFKHTEPLPDVCVPMWYDYWTGGEELGHVTIWVPGKGIYSSPWQSGTDHAVLSSIADVERIYGVKYVGWSEDISKVRVIKQEVFMPNSQQANDFWKKYLGRDLTPEQMTYYTAQPWNVLEDDTISTLKAESDAKIADLTKKLSLAQAVSGDATAAQALKAALKAFLGL